MLDLKRKLDEIIAIYSLEDELVDIYVEGPTDKFIIENYCEYKKIGNTVIEIDTIDLSSIQEEFDDLNLKSNKDKLIALSRILAKNETKSNVSCVVDRDFDGIIKELENNNHLIYTDYSCIESYLVCKKHIEKITTIGIRNFPYQSEFIINEISKVLCGLFILRMINHEFKLNHNFPRIDNNMHINRATGLCSFDFDNYLEIYITTNRLIGLKKEILEFVQKVTNILDPDIRFNMNGHDFIEVLFNYINKVKNTPNFRFENFERALLLAVQPNYLDEYNLFKELSA